MLLKLTVLVGAVAQIFAAGYLSVGTFETSERVLPVFIQPASWAFAIWGLIYILSLIYAVYQVIPDHDSGTVRRTRVPAAVAFFGSIVWLWFAGQDAPLVWLTIPTLFIMALALTRVVTAPRSDSSITNFFAIKTLLPYAAWTGIAAWLNIQSLAVDQNVITTNSLNITSNLVLFTAIAAYGLYFYRRSDYNIWYGGVLVWASVAVAWGNYMREAWVFVALSGVLALVVAGLYVRAQRR
jgi:hypothetical protein